MITTALEERIREIAGGYPDGRSALLPALELVQRSGGGSLTHEDVRAVARLLGIPAANLLTNPALDEEAKIPEYKVCAARVRRSGGLAVDPPVQIEDNYAQKTRRD